MPQLAQAALIERALPVIKPIAHREFEFIVGVLTGFQITNKRKFEHGDIGAAATEHTVIPPEKADLALQRRMNQRIKQRAALAEIGRAAPAFA